PGTTPVWQEIARKAEGRFVRIAQDGGVQSVSTPYDEKLAVLNARLAQSAVVYGDAPTQTAANYKMQMAAALIVPPPPSSGAGGGPASAGFSTCAPMTCAPAAMPPTAMSSAAERAGYCARTGVVGALDLVDGINAGKVKLEDTKTEELPPEMRKLNLAERRAYLAQVEAQRARPREGGAGPGPAAHRVPPARDEPHRRHRVRR